MMVAYCFIQKDLDNFEIPVWTELSARWYQRLNRLARKHKMSRKDVLEEALKAFDKSKKTEKLGGGEEAIKKAFGTFAKEWWNSLTPEQRVVESAKRSEIARKRWAKQKKPN
jgi:hypothetical protein